MGSQNPSQSSGNRWRLTFSKVERTCISDYIFSKNGERALTLNSELREGPYHPLWCPRPLTAPPNSKAKPFWSECVCRETPKVASKSTTKRDTPNIRPAVNLVILSISPSRLIVWAVLCCFNDLAGRPSMLKEKMFARGGGCRHSANVLNPEMNV